ncbi:MAG TPA: alpha/beta fold hydrolase [Gammaproteobacteria bacterium]
MLLDAPLSPPIRTASMLLLLAASAVARHGHAAPEPPRQPAHGPGGSEYAYERVEAAAHGEGNDRYWIFTPAGRTTAVAVPASVTDVPVVVFLHGWGAMNPVHYGAWIEHLVRRGHTVVYPQYQESLRVPPAAMIDHAVAAVREAFRRLGEPPRWAVIGHSLGGTIAANLAARSAAVGLRPPAMVLSVEPGMAPPGKRPAGGRGTVPLDDLGSLPRDLVLVTVAGDRDEVVGADAARLIFARATGVAPTHKRYVVVRSDEHGSPPIIANHRAPSARNDDFDLLTRPERSARPGSRLLERRLCGGDCDQREATDRGAVDAIDWYAFWKLSDGLIEIAATGGARPFTAENERMLADMGRWSDGTPVRPLEIHAVLPEPPMRR